VTANKSCSTRLRRGEPAVVPAHDDLPEYALRMSDRARRVRLTVTPRDGLVVVVPRRMRGFDPSAIVREHRAWIESACARVGERRAALRAGADALLPDSVSFPATGEMWGVEYRATEATTVRARVDGTLLVVQGAVHDGEACLAALQRWLQRAAAERLLPWLAEESARTGLAYARATVRGQRSRWGGCSSSGSITLNRCLLFLSRELMRAVVIHELAHLRHHNHSAEFWRELERLDAEAIAHRKAIGCAWDSVPPWAEP
jgi:predicted metal-dependent hydrolase